jgi:hypothetical protein
VSFVKLCAEKCAMSGVVGKITLKLCTATLYKNSIVKKDFVKPEYFFMEWEKTFLFKIS